MQDVACAPSGFLVRLGDRRKSSVNHPRICFSIGSSPGGLENSHTLKAPTTNQFFVNPLFIYPHKKKWPTEKGRQRAQRHNMEESRKLMKIEVLCEDNWSCASKSLLVCVWSEVADVEEAHKYLTFSTNAGPEIKVLWVPNTLAARFHPVNLLSCFGSFMLRSSRPQKSGDTTGGSEGPARPCLFFLHTLQNDLADGSSIFQNTCPLKTECCFESTKCSALQA